jgi:hypothetical protein
MAETTYKQIFDPIKLGRAKLIRQDRIDLNPVFHCISWRENREASGGKRVTNRRFYIEADSCWSLSMDDTLNMLRRASKAGFFDDSEVDPGVISSFVVADPAYPNYPEVIEQALSGGDFDDEWRGGYAVICTQVSGRWRKVMMANSAITKVTFRSLTNDSKYGMTRSEKSADGWTLDAAMLDAHVTAFRFWFDYLESIVCNKPYQSDKGEG